MVLVYLIDMNLESLLNEFFVFLSANRGLSINSCKAYESDLKFFCEYFKHRKLNDVNLFEYINEQKKLYKPASLNRKMSSLRAFFNIC